MNYLEHSDDRSGLLSAHRGQRAAAEPVDARGAPGWECSRRTIRCALAGQSLAALPVRRKLGTSGQEQCASQRCRHRSNPTSVSSLTFTRSRHARSECRPIGLSRDCTSPSQPGGPRLTASRCSHSTPAWLPPQAPLPYRRGRRGVRTHPHGCPLGEGGTVRRRRR